MHIYVIGWVDKEFRHMQRQMAKMDLENEKEQEETNEKEGGGKVEDEKDENKQSDEKEGNTESSDTEAIEAAAKQGVASSKRRKRRLLYKNRLNKNKEKEKEKEKDPYHVFTALAEKIGNRLNPKEKEDIQRLMSGNFDDLKQNTSVYMQIFEKLRALMTPEEEKMINEAMGVPQKDTPDFNAIQRRKDRRNNKEFKKNDKESKKSDKGSKKNDKRSQKYKIEDMDELQDSDSEFEDQEPTNAQKVYFPIKRLNEEKIAQNMKKHYQEMESVKVFNRTHIRSIPYGWKESLAYTGKILVGVLPLPLSAWCSFFSLYVLLKLMV